MPGILPMKVIKVGTNAQTRIAQACDRCRSKKIRCDGIRPCCSQCANVGFECKTSDKLSRRAFPRGYTESLEERVRSLEQEVRELKDLLDEKDEKIDMLTRIHSQSSHPSGQLPRRRSSPTVNDGKGDTNAKDEIFEVQQSPHLEGEGASAYVSGSSSAKTFLEAFKHKVQETGRSTADIDTDRLLDNIAEKSEDYTNQDTVIWKPPPRLSSDQLINVFFQEWAPLFPILHRPSFLGLYEKYVTNSETVTDRAELAQLNLVFGIAALSSGTRSTSDLESFEMQWKAAIDAVLKDNSMASLQALLLAQIFCIQQGDLRGLLTYKGLSITLSARLGLHQSQKRFALGTLTCETRKKVFWTLYTVDCFAATVLGTPKQLKDDDIQCEYPVDADDEYVTERGFTPTLPGESTKLSSALALFRVARILSKVLEEVFPAKATYELSLKRLADLSDELDKWNTSLPSHLHLQFVQDKPSTSTINSRSPILSLSYHYVRALIQRPVVGANLGSRSSSSMIAMATSCKHMIQIVQLLIERGMSFSFCLNRDEVLVVSGFGMLYQGLNLDPNSKILKDNAKMVNAVIAILEESRAPCAAEFKRIAHSFIPAQAKEPEPKTKTTTLSRHNSDGAVVQQTMQSPTSPTSLARKNLKAIASRFTGNGSPKKPSLDATDHRRATVHNISLHPQGVPSQSVPSLQPPPPRIASTSSTSLSLYDTSSISRSEPARSPINMFSRTPSNGGRPLNGISQPMKPKLRPNAPTLTNLDYLSFGNEPEMQSHAHNRPTKPIKTEPGPTDWEKLIGSLDNGQSNIYDACYGGSSAEALFDSPNLGMHHNNHSAHTLHDVSWNPDLFALAQTQTNASAHSVLTTSSGQADSILSFSTDERDMNSSNEDFANTDWTAINNVTGNSEQYRGIMLPELGQDELTFGNSWDTPLNL